MTKNQIGNVNKDYKINQHHLLGSGSTGTVYKGSQLSTGAYVAIKIIDLETIDNQVSEYLLKMEKNALMTLNHPNLLRCYQVYHDERYCYFITEFCNGGTLKDILIQQGPLTEAKTLHIIQQLLGGYFQCVRKKIIHRDIKPANIMLNDGQPKLIDFGYCMIEGFSQPLLEYNVGSPSYMAPQTFKWNMYNQKTEIWAIGVTIYECITGKTLDQGRKMSETFKEILEKGISYPHSMSERCKRIISWCLEYDPKNRPNCSQLYSFLKSEPMLPLQPTDRTSTHNLRNPSFSFLNGFSPSSKHQLSYYNSHKNLDENQRQAYKVSNIKPLPNLYESVKHTKQLQKAKPSNYFEGRNRYLTNFQRLKSFDCKLDLQKQPPTKTQRAMNFMGNKNYFYQKLACNTLR